MLQSKRSLLGENYAICERKVKGGLCIFTRHPVTFFLYIAYASSNYI